MGVNYRGNGGLVLRIWSGGANVNCPQDFVMFQNFKDQIACITFTMQKNVMLTLAVMAAHILPLIPA